jgi:hypothetical protein
LNPRPTVYEGPGKDHTINRCATLRTRDAACVDPDLPCFPLRRSDSSPFVTDDARPAAAALAAYLEVRANQIAALLMAGWTPPGGAS